MESSIRKWETLLPSSCLITGRERVESFERVKDEVSLGLMKRLNLYFPMISHPKEAPVNENLLLLSVLSRSTTIDADLLGEICSNGAYGRSFIDRLHDSWDNATLDLIPCSLLRTTEASFATAKKRDEKIKRIIIRRIQFASRAREIFTRLGVPPLPVGTSRHNSISIWLKMTTLDSQVPNLVCVADLMGQNIFHQFAKTTDRHPLECKFEYASKKHVHTAANAPDLLGRTPLYVACESNADVAFIEKLIYWVADPKFSKLDWGLTVMHFSAAIGHSDLLRALLYRFPSLGWTCDDWKRLPIFNAAMHGHHNLVECLLNCMWKALLDVTLSEGTKSKEWIVHQDFDGRSFFSWAAGGGHQKFIEAAVQWAHSFEVYAALQFLHMPDREGLTAQNWAAKNNHVPTANYLGKLNTKAVIWQTRGMVRCTTELWNEEFLWLVGGSPISFGGSERMFFLFID